MRNGHDCAYVVVFQALENLTVSPRKTEGWVLAPRGRSNLVRRIKIHLLLEAKAGLRAVSKFHFANSLECQLKTDRSSAFPQFEWELPVVLTKSAPFKRYAIPVLVRHFDHSEMPSTPWSGADQTT